ncbi:MAG: fused MFS/spermidine synthase [Sedimentisphaerales bacterium]|nr:fused MFS/spermidine synthase [Sedimentisphaerales bacterium]
MPDTERIEQDHHPIVCVPKNLGILPLLLVLFVGSGLAALIYEIVWFQLLELVIGSSAVSLGVLLGTYMGGMCLGSILLPRLIPPRWQPLRVYALLELGIGIAGLAVLVGVPWVGRLYVTWVGHGLPGILLRGTVCAMCLLLPTAFMGGTLPAIARAVEATPRGVCWLGFLYGGNIVGAMFGCLLAGFYLLRVHDMATATYLAAAINAAVALIGLAVSAAKASYPNAVPNQDRAVSTPKVLSPGAWAVYVVIALSGMTALASEVIWTRLLSLLLGATVYTFSIILAVFLAGLGIGSALGAAMARSARPRVALGACQLLLGGAITWAAYAICRSLPNWPVDPSLASNPWYAFHLDLMRCAWAVLPAAMIWGASFPLALASIVHPGQDPGRMVGGVYAANTIGAILGALGASLVAIPTFGTQHAQQGLIVISGVSAVLAFVSVFILSNRQISRFLGLAIAIVGVAVLTGLLVRRLPKVPPNLIAYGRYVATYRDLPAFLYVGEGMNASVAVTETSYGVRNFHVSGKVEASSEPQDMRLQRMLGHISALVHPNPTSVLVVGCGAGVTAGSFVTYPSIRRIVICEIEPLIPRIVARYFDKENHGLMTDQRVEVVYDDARHYILTTRERFDIITSDPIHPWVKGSATLYTKEYFELVRDHLNPGGVVTQWVPLYQSSPEVVKSELATFFKVFPNGTIWSNDISGQGYDMVLLGRLGNPAIDVDAIQARLDRADHALVVQSLMEVGFRSAIDLLATYGGQGPDLQPWLKGATINQDRNLRLQYLAGMGVEYYQGSQIYNQMKAYRRFPDEIFVADLQQKEALRQAIEGTQ